MFNMTLHRRSSLCTVVAVVFVFLTASIYSMPMQQLGIHIPRGGAVLDGVSTALEIVNSTTIPSTKPRGKNRFFFLNRLFQRKNRHTSTRRTVKKQLQQMNEKLEEARRTFLDRMAAVSFTLINQEHDALVLNNGTFFQLDGDDDDIMPQSDLSLPNRRIYIVTTASLPWRTGTAVNPLLRAAYLSRKMKEINTHNQTATTPSQQMVTLVIPWLELEEDRLELYGSSHNFSQPQEQEDYIRDWLRGANMSDEADPDNGLRILFYNARYHSGLKSIFAMGDICAYLTNQTEEGTNLSDAVCVLEEPEHLNWYRAPGEGWTKVFGFVVGVVHTNYVEYASGQFHGLWTAPAIHVMSSAMIRAYCHKVIKLSGVLQTYAPEKETCQNVHGVREAFISEGRRRALESSLNCTDSESSGALNEEEGGQVYFVGKILWAKGFEQMLQLQDFYYECTGKYFAIDVYGSGPEEGEIKRAFHGRRNNNRKVRADGEESGSDADETIFQENLRKIKSIEVPKSRYEYRRRPIPANFCGPVDHSLLGKYKTFINPSTSEVLCTTTFEALAMGKFVIIPVHESNKFFLQFPNCLAYRNKWEFIANLRWALTHEPEPLTPELAMEFTWEAATDRLIRSSAITRREAKARHHLGKAKLDERIAYFHRELGKHDALRRVLGGGPIANQVRYELERQGLEDEHSSDKFSASSFVKAIKTSFINTNLQSAAV